MKISRIQHGLTLIEAVLGMLILTSCLIVVAALYHQRQNAARGGLLHERAVQLAQSLAEEIRNNAAGADYQSKLGATCDASETVTSQPTMPEQRVACWQDTVTRELTNGSGLVSLDRTLIPAQYIIIVNWSEPRSGTASYVLRVTPPEPEAGTIKKGAARAAD